MTGCGRSPQTVPVAPLNPPAASTTFTPAAPQGATQAPVNSLPAASQTTQGVLQNAIPLNVIDPADGAELSTDTVTVRGQTLPAAVIRVNEASGVADSGGNFSLSVSLEPGLNGIDVIATDNGGNEGEVLILVNSVSPGTSSGVGQSASSGLSTIPLQLTQPVDGATLKAGSVTIKGQTVQGATVVINDQVETADANGNFSVNLPMLAGPNAIDVIAQDSYGNDNEVIIMVNVV
jgi:hypothetical protein